MTEYLKHGDYRRAIVTVESYPVFRDGEYETRDGRRAVVLGCVPTLVEMGECITGYVSDETSEATEVISWDIIGRSACQGNDGGDLMRPWEERKKESD